MDWIKDWSVVSLNRLKLVPSHLYLLFRITRFSNPLVFSELATFSLLPTKGCVDPKFPRTEVTSFCWVSVHVSVYVTWVYSEERSTYSQKLVLKKNANIKGSLDFSRRICFPSGIGGPTTSFGSGYHSSPQAFQELIKCSSRRNTCIIRTRCPSCTDYDNLCLIFDSYTLFSTFMSHRARTPSSLLESPITKFSTVSSHNS